MFDSEMSMKAHISSINRSAYPQLKNLRAIKPFLDMEAENTAAHAFVSSRLDAGNSILYGIAQGQLQRIQRILNTAARIITNTRQYEHMTPVLRQLHWLPIQERIEFKVLCLTYKVIHNMAPLYLTQFLSQKIVPRHLRCKDEYLLHVPLTSLKYTGERSFQKAAPMLYNALPVTIKHSSFSSSLYKKVKDILIYKSIHGID